MVLQNTLEHLTNPDSVFRRSARATRSGGWIDICVSSVDKLPTYGDWYYVLDARSHLTDFIFDALTWLLAQAAYSDVTVVATA